MIPEGWTQRTLQQLSRKPISYGIVQTGEPVESGVRCVRVLDITKSPITPDEFITTSQEISQSYKRTLLEPDDVIVALRGEIGCCVLVRDGLVGCNLTRGLARIAPKQDEVYPPFVVQMLHSPHMQRVFEQKKNGSALQEISIGELRRVTIPIPSLPAQKEIATILLTWDRAIESVENLFTTKQKRRQALMQQLLTGKVRFPEFAPQQWQQVPLGDLVRDTKRPVVWDDAALYKLASIRRHSQGMFYREPAYGHQIKVKKLFEVKANDFLISNIQAAYGAMGIVPAAFDGAFISDQYTVLVPIDPAKFDIRFLGFVSELPWFRHQIRMASNGFFAERLRLLFDVEALLKRKLPVPPTVAEQQKIATVLSTANDEVETLTRKLDALRRQKKGLMQQLLTGKVRVKVPATEPPEV